MRSFADLSQFSGDRSPQLMTSARETAINFELLSSRLSLANQNKTQGIALKTPNRIVAGFLLCTLFAGAASAQSLQNCQDFIPQDATKVFRSGLWKQWIYWITPGPDAYAAIQRVVTEVNAARASAGLPTLTADPTNPLILSVFDESNPRGLNGSSAVDTNLSNEEVFVATFVSDAAGGGEVLFLTDPIRSNSVLTTVKLVPGVAGKINRVIGSFFNAGKTGVATDWDIVSANNDKIQFSAVYPDTAINFRAISPTSRITYANCNLVSFSDLIYRGTPTLGYTLFDRSQANYVDVTSKQVRVRVRVKHHDPDINAMFADPHNEPALLIETDRDVRIESK
jgi:hypothetical protein